MKPTRYGTTPEQIRSLVADVPYINEATPERRADIERRYRRALHASYVRGGAEWRKKP